MTNLTFSGLTPKCLSFYLKKEENIIIITAIVGFSFRIYSGMFAQYVWNGADWSEIS